MNTSEGGKTLRETMIRKHGSEEAWKKSMQENGRRGGLAKVPKGFAVFDSEKHITASIKGGRVSRRAKRDEV